MQNFISKQAAEIVGVSMRQLVHWDAKGLVKPSVQPAAGRGSRRLYSYEDLVALQAVKRLRDQQVSLQGIRKCVLYLRKRLPNMTKPLNYCTLLTDGKEIYLKESPESLTATVRKQGQKAWLQLSIAGIDKELRSRVLRLGRNSVETVTVGEFAYQVEIQPDEDGGYVAEVAGLPGCVTQGDSLKETLENAKDAIETYLEAVEDLRRRGVRLPLKAQARRRKSAG